MSLRRTCCGAVPGHHPFCAQCSSSGPTSTGTMWAYGPRAHGIGKVGGMDCYTYSGQAYGYTYGAVWQTGDIHYVGRNDQYNYGLCSPTYTVASGNLGYLSLLRLILVSGGTGYTNPVFRLSQQKQGVENVHATINEETGEITSVALNTPMDFFVDGTSDVPIGVYVDDPTGYGAIIDIEVGCKTGVTQYIGDGPDINSVSHTGYLVWHEDQSVLSGNIGGTDIELPVTYEPLAGWCSLPFNVPIGGKAKIEWTADGPDTSAWYIEFPKKHQDIFPGPFEIDLSDSLDYDNGYYSKCINGATDIIFDTQDLGHNQSGLGTVIWRACRATVEICPSGVSAVITVSVYIGVYQISPTVDGPPIAGENGFIPGGIPYQTFQYFTGDMTKGTGIFSSGCDPQTTDTIVYSQNPWFSSSELSYHMQTPDSMNKVKVSLTFSDSDVSSKTCCKKIQVLACNGLPLKEGFAVYAMTPGYEKWFNSGLSGFIGIGQGWDGYALLSLPESVPVVLKAVLPRTLRNTDIYGTLHYTPSCDTDDIVEISLDMGDSHICDSGCTRPYYKVGALTLTGSLLGAGISIPLNWNNIDSWVGSYVFNWRGCPNNGVSASTFTLNAQVNLNGTLTLSAGQFSDGSLSDLGETVSQSFPFTKLCPEDGLWVANLPKSPYQPKNMLWLAESSPMIFWAPNHGLTDSGSVYIVGTEGYQEGTLTEQPYTPDYYFNKVYAVTVVDANRLSIDSLNGNGMLMKLLTQFPTFTHSVHPNPSLNVVVGHFEWIDSNGVLHSNSGGSFTLVDNSSTTFACDSSNHLIVGSDWPVSGDFIKLGTAITSGGYVTSIDYVGVRFYTFRATYERVDLSLWGVLGCKEIGTAVF